MEEVTYFLSQDCWEHQVQPYRSGLEQGQGPVHSFISKIFLAETGHQVEKLKGAHSKAPEVFLGPSLGVVEQSGHRDTGKAQGEH